MHMITMVNNETETLKESLNAFTSIVEGDRCFILCADNGITM